MREITHDKKRGNRNRNLVLSVPLRIILNGAGVSFFISHKRLLHAFETADGVRQFGFHLEQTRFAWLKKLLIKGYIEKIEIQVRNITAHRLHLEDAVKMAFFSMFRRRINLSILECMYDSSMLRSWNRTHPKKSIGPSVRIAEKSIRELLNARAPGACAEIKAEIYNRIMQRLPSSTPDIREDSRWIRNFIRELIGELNPLIFFVLIGSKRDERFALMRNLTDKVMEFMNCLDVLNLSSLLAIELVSAAERSTLVKFLNDTGDIRGILESPEQRQSIMEARHFRGSTVVIAVPGEVPPEKQRLRFRLSVYNDGADVEAERKLMEDVSERSCGFMAGQHLEDFFKTPPAKRGLDVYEDNGLCFYYLTVLQDQCRKNNIILDSHIKKSHSGKSVVTTLRFGF
ncbi:MAG: hypothetical protein LBS57_12495 [Treponema sp.]|jgi:hypothetical protein|nr:hypothetical protein [Treponema sp.]